MLSLTSGSRHAPRLYWASVRRHDPEMADIINLRTFRKAKARTNAAEQAAANRAQSGRSKAEKKLIKAEKERINTHLDQSRRETSDTE